MFRRVRGDHGSGMELQRWDVHVVRAARNEWRRCVTCSSSVVICAAMEAPMVFAKLIGGQNVNKGENR